MVRQNDHVLIGSIYYMAGVAKLLPQKSPRNRLKSLQGGENKLVFSFKDPIF